MMKFLFYLWQLPQNIIGIILYLYYRKSTISTFTFKYENVYRAQKMKGGISLGNYIIVSTRMSPTDVEHEKGHSVQSRILGPLYLLVIGLPSIIHAIFHDNYCKDKNYYHFYTEKWADSIKGITR